MTGTLRSDAEICNAKGLHARAAAKFCKTVEQFEVDVRVSRNGTEVAGTSIMGLMMLAAGRGSMIEIIVSGPDASAALDALKTLVANKFDEE